MCAIPQPRGVTPGDQTGKIQHTSSDGETPQPFALGTQGVDEEFVKGESSMPDRKLLLLAAILFAAGCSNESADNDAETALEYPTTRVVEQSDVYHGVTVP